MDKPFKSWSLEDVQRHNAKVAAGFRKQFADLRQEGAASGGLGQSETALPATPRAKPKAKRVPKDKELTRAEQSFLEVLRRDPAVTCLRVHAHTLLLAEGTRYTPDFSGIVKGRLTFWEVKGPYVWEDAWVKVKCAAAFYPEYDFIMAQKPKGSDWALSPIAKPAGYSIGRNLP